MYQPTPRDTSEITLPADLLALGELIAENVHDTWAKGKLDQGCTTHPDLVPYADLSEATKDYDRRTAMSTLRLIKALGFDIVKHPVETIEPVRPSQLHVGDAVRRINHRHVLAGDEH